MFLKHLYVILCKFCVLLLLCSTWWHHNGNIFWVTGPLWGESTGYRWIPLTKATDMKLWCFLWCVPEQMVEQTLELLVIWDAMMSMWCHSNEWWHHNQLRNALWDLAIVTQAHKRWKKCPHTPAVVMSGHQPSKHGDVTNLSRATCDVYGRKLDIKRSVNMINKCAN